MIYDGGSFLRRAMRNIVIFLEIQGILYIYIYF